MALNFPSNPSLNDTYSYNGKTWVFNGSAWIQTRTETVDITTSGNVTANSFIGDGSQLTGLPAGYTDSNVASYLPTHTGNITAGNILTDNYFYANGDPFTSYTDTDVETLLSGNITAGNISVTGTIDGYATTSYVDSEVANLVASAPATLDTLNELATALGNDPNLSTTLTSLIGNNSANITTLQGNITTLESDITNLEANIPANLQSNVTTLESDVSTLQGNIVTLESDITNLEANIPANLQSNVTTLESDVFTLQGNIVTLDNQVANLNYYDDTNVTTFLSDIGSNNISTTGDITANSFIGDGSQLTGLPESYTDSNVESVLSGNITVGNIEVTGTIDGYATTTYVDTEVANLVASAPSTLDTLNELASALGNDPNLSTTLTSLIGNNSANITVLQGNITSIESDITNLEANIPANLQSNVTTLESDVSTLQGNIVTLDNQVANLNYYDDTNVTTFLSDLGSNSIATTGNITADYFIGNGSSLTGINAGTNVTFSNNPPVSPSDGDIWIDSSLGIEFVYFNDGDSSQWVDMKSTIIQGDTTYSDTNVATYLENISGNLIPSANVTYNLGSETKRWNTLYLAGNTINLGGAQIKADPGAGTIALIPQVKDGESSTKAIVIGSSGISTVDTDANGTVSSDDIESAAVSANTSVGNLIATGNITTSNITVTGKINGTIAQGTITLSQPGSITSPYTGVSRFYPTSNLVITNVFASLGTVSSNDFIFKINKNGSNIGLYTVNANSHRMSGVTSNISVSSTDYLTLDVTSGTGATDLRVDLKYTLD